MTRFGILIRDLRRKRGLTLDTVAEKAGTGKGYVSGIERGKVSPPSPKFLKKLSRILKCDYRELLVRAHLEKAPQEVRREMVGLYDAWETKRKG